MSRVDNGFIDALKTQQVQHALTSIGTPPQNPTTFEYGRAVGILQGMQLAEALYLKALSEESKRE
jgi:hypothetical protein